MHVMSLARGRSGRLEGTPMLWKHLGAVLAGPVLVTVGVPVLIAATVGTGTMEVPPALAWILIGTGAVIGAGGVGMLGWAIGLFARDGKGTLAPFGPPHKLVVRGPYQHVRNPMYAAVLFILLGEALVVRSPVFLLWLVVFFLPLAILVPLVEEPRLVRRFGTDYTLYRQHVPRWLPRLRPWSPTAEQ